MTSLQLLDEALLKARKAIVFTVVADLCLMLAITALLWASPSLLAVLLAAVALSFLIGAAMNTAAEIALARHADLLRQVEQYRFRRTGK